MNAKVRALKRAPARGSARTAGDSGSASPDSSTAGSVDLGVLDDLVGYHIRRAASVFLEDFGQALADTGMRQVLFGILSVIAANPGINQGGVGRALGIQRANMVGLVNELVERALVRRLPVAGDRRAFSLTLTRKGRKAIDDSLARIRRHEDRLLADLSAAERAMLVELLGRIEKKAP